jgi:hypothetical protein
VTPEASSDLSSPDQSEQAYERVLRGIPRWLLKGYLEDLGGRVVPISPGDDQAPDEDRLTADGWQARLTQIEDFEIGSLRSGQVRLTVTGDAEAVQAMLAALEPRLFRGGG